MDQHKIDIITGNDRNSAGIENPAGAAVGEAFIAHEGSIEAHSGRQGSIEADSGSQPPYVHRQIELHEVQDGKEDMINPEQRIRTLAEVKGLESTNINLWKVAFEDFSESCTILQNRIYKTDEEMRSVKNEIYQVVGFFSAFQGLLITAAAQSNLLRCNNVGFILALSAFATAVALFGIWQKITAMEELRFNANRIKYFWQKITAMEEMRSANYKITVHVKIFNQWLSYLRANGINFHFHDLRRYSEICRLRFMPQKQISDTYGTWLVVSVIAFGGLCMVAMRQILCNPGHCLPSN